MRREVVIGYIVAVLLIVIEILLANRDMVGWKTDVHGREQWPPT